MGHIGHVASDERIAKPYSRTHDDDILSDESQSKKKRTAEGSMRRVSSPLWIPVCLLIPASFSAPELAPDLQRQDGPLAGEVHPEEAPEALPPHDPPAAQDKAG